MEFVLFFVSFAIVLGAQALVSGTYRRYSVILNKKGLTGFDIARHILDANGLQDIKIVETKGKLTDHYDPTRKVVRLSSEVYHDATISAIAVSAHECGHVIQHKEKYGPMTIRNVIAPLVNLVSYIGYIVLIIGIMASIFNVAVVGIVMLSITLIFQLITLPVEFNASKRAIAILESNNLIEMEEKESVRAMLTSAALTYVASLLANILEILRLFLTANRNRD
jgi:Zn-dependent membrane protease YugP